MILQREQVLMMPQAFLAAALLVFMFSLRRMVAKFTTRVPKFWVCFGRWAVFGCPWMETVIARTPLSGKLNSMNADVARA